MRQPVHLRSDFISVHLRSCVVSAFLALIMAGVGILPAVAQEARHAKTKTKEKSAASQQVAETNAQAVATEEDELSAADLNAIAQIKEEGFQNSQVMDTMS